MPKYYDVPLEIAEDTTKLADYLSSATYFVDDSDIQLALANNGFEQSHDDPTVFVCRLQGREDEWVKIIEVD